MANSGGESSGVGADAVIRLPRKRAHDERSRRKLRGLLA